MGKKNWGARTPQAAVEVQDFLFFLNTPKQKQHTHTSGSWLADLSWNLDSGPRAARWGQGGPQAVNGSASCAACCPASNQPGFEPQLSGLLWDAARLACTASQQRAAARHVSGLKLGLVRCEVTGTKTVCGSASCGCPAGNSSQRS